MERGKVKVKVNFAIDADGIVKVTAQDLHTGNNVDMLIEACSNLSADEVQEMKFDDLGF
jgi:molecular chaperone DnaK (HSP70)